MKKIIVAIPQMILIVIGLPFFLFDLAKKNIVCEKVVNKINDYVFLLEQWGDR